MGVRVGGILTRAVRLGAAAVPPPSDGDDPILGLPAELVDSLRHLHFLIFRLRFLSVTRSIFHKLECGPFRSVAGLLLRLAGLLLRLVGLLLRLVGLLLRLVGLLLRLVGPLLRLVGLLLRLGVHRFPFAISILRGFILCRLLLCRLGFFRFLVDRFLVDRFLLDRFRLLRLGCCGLVRWGLFATFLLSVILLLLRHRGGHRGFSRSRIFCRFRLVGFFRPRLSRSRFWRLRCRSCSCWRLLLLLERLFGLGRALLGLGGGVVHVVGGVELLDETEARFVFGVALVRQICRLLRLVFLLFQGVLDDSLVQAEEPVRFAPIGEQPARLHLRLQLSDREAIKLARFARQLAGLLHLCRARLLLKDSGEADQAQKSRCLKAGAGNGEDSRGIRTINLEPLRSQLSALSPQLTALDLASPILIYNIKFYHSYIIIPYRT
eukprot:scaffold834_cov244-Pinguiococcus_pyrenoidosus.AAC.9